MPREYFPQNDRELRDWFTNFVNVLGGNLAQLGLVAGDMAQLDTDVTAFDAALNNYIAQQTLTASASSQKKSTKTAAVASLRPLVRRIQNHPGMTPALRTLLGLPEQGSGGSETPLSELTPLLNLETGKGSVIVHWGPEPGNERINGKPEGVWAASIYRKKVDETKYSLVGVSNTSPYHDPITGPASDYVYIVQYRGKKAEDVSQTSNPQVITAGGMLAA